MIIPIQLTTHIAYRDLRTGRFASTAEYLAQTARLSRQAVKARAFALGVMMGIAIHRQSEQAARAFRHEQIMVKVNGGVIRKTPLATRSQATQWFS